MRDGRFVSHINESATNGDYALYQHLKKEKWGYTFTV